LFDELRLVVASQVSRLYGPRARVPVDRDRPALLPHEDVPGGKLAEVLEDRIRSRNRVEREKRLERVEIDLAARQRAQLGRKLERAGDRSEERRVGEGCRTRSPASAVTHMTMT